MRRGFFFSMDAFLASMLLVSMVLLINVYYSDSPAFEQTSMVAQDTMQALSTIQIREMNDPWVQARIADGTIDEPRVSVVHQLAKFWALNQTSEAEQLAKILTKELPEEYKIEMLYEDDLLYNTTGTNRSVASAKRMVSGVSKGESLTGSAGTAFLQKVSGKKTSKFAYFGGFVGQGNITTILEGLPSDITVENVEEIILEGEFDGDFTVKINDNQCGGTYTGSTTDLEIRNYNLSSCAEYLEPGDNIILVEFSSLQEASISGGFLKVEYTTSEFSESVPDGEETIFLPGIAGVVNLYDGLLVPGNLTNMTLHLHYESTSGDRPIFFDIGNTTVYENNATGEIEVTLSDSYLKGFVDYTNFDSTTVPLRFGYYEGNNTNNTGNITDVFLITSRAGPMSLADIDGTTETRMEAAKRLDKSFINVVLSNIGNRLGLVSYFASDSYDHALSTDNASLQSTVDGYNVQNPSQAQRALCHSMEEARDRLTSEPNDRNRAVLLMTDGDTTKCCSSGKCTAAKARQDAVDVACNYYSSTGINYYTVGFGQDAANNPGVRSMLSEIANCTEGKFADSANITTLEEIYDEFADEIAQSSIVYTYQRVTESTNVKSELFSDSHFNISYETNIQEPGPTQMGLTFQTEPFTTCNPTVDINPALDVVRAELISYSGDFWTKRISVDGTTVYNLSKWADDYQLLGDPSRVHIPENLLSGGSHTFDMVLGANATTDENCSTNNTLIYTALLNTSVSRGSVLPNTQGCNWNVEFEDGNFLNISIPSDYTGTKTCSYTSTNISYDPTDSYDEVVFRLLENLDFDDDGQIFVNLDEADLQVVVSIVENIPYLWGPSMARVVVSR